MVKWLILSSVIILSSCAQVGRLTGGDKDISAPQTEEKSFEPKNESVNFQGNEVEISFDEFVRLNKPSESIKMIPGNTRVSAEVDGRKVKLTWRDTLAANTTYAIYLNKTIQDITEGNDSLMQYVFSTGDIIDSLSLKLAVKDAWANTAENGYIAILKNVQTNEVVSFAESDERGQISLNYLKSGEYEVVIFDDLNQDFLLDDHEKVGFPDWKTIDLKESFQDTIPVRMFHQIGIEKVSSVNYFHPGKLMIGFNYEPKNVTLFFNDKEIDTANIVQVEKDSLFAYIPRTQEVLNELIVKTDKSIDTFEIRMPKENAVLKMNPDKGSKRYLPEENFSFITEDLITKIDTSKVKVVRNRDSLLINGTWNVTKNKIEFIADSISPDIYRFSFEKGSVTSLNTDLEEQEFLLTKTDSSEYGTLSLSLIGYNEPIVLVVMKGKTIEREVTITNFNSTVFLNRLTPGTYHFKVVLDKNQNGKWDSGDYDSRRQPEMVHEYSKIIKVRANWDIEADIERLYE